MEVVGIRGMHVAGRRGDVGLTTLEWLLLVAAVAGLAALAVASLAERRKAEVPTNQSETDEINRRYQRTHA